MLNDNIGSLPSVSGYIKAELLDPVTGKVVDKTEKHNAVMDYTAEYYKAMQKQFWLQYNYSNGNAYRPSAPRFPATHILLTDDSSVPSPTDASISGNLIGWASRWPVGSPTGKRGNVNTALCSLSESSSTWVFEWPTSNGNGTFQSISWGVANNDAYYRDATGTLVSIGNMINNVAPGGTKSTAFYYSDGLGYGINLNNYTGTSYGPVLYSFDPINGGDTTTIFSNSTAAWTSSTGVLAFVKFGSDWILLVKTSNTSMGTIRINSSGTIIYQYAVLPGTYGLSSNGSITTNGTTVWVSAGTTTQSNVYSINTTNGTGTSIFSFPNATASNASPLIYNGTNFTVFYSLDGSWVTEKRTYSLTGTLLSTENLNFSSSASISETLVSPYSGAVTYDVSIARAFNIIVPFATLSSSGTTIPIDGSGYGFNGPRFIGTNIVLGPNQEYWTRLSNNIYKLNANIVSTRARLDVPITKTSANGLRITYVLNYV